MKPPRYPLSWLVVIFVVSLTLGVAVGVPAQDTTPATKPPVAPVRLVTDEYFGIKVADPYRYMENIEDPEVQAWMKAQNDYTRALLAKLPGRDALLKRVIELDNSTPATVSSVTRTATERYFYLE
jgi:prolyl oligopeptidase